jgi:hypothetical protein
MQEFLVFASKTLMKRLPAGIHCVEYESELSLAIIGFAAPVLAACSTQRFKSCDAAAVNQCYCIVGSDGLGAIAICDRVRPQAVVVPRSASAMHAIRLVIVMAISFPVQEYPARVAVSMLKELTASFKGDVG